MSKANFRLPLVVGFRLTSTILQFLMGIILARAVGPADLGQVFTYLNIIIFLGTVAGLGVPDYLLRKFRSYIIDNQDQTLVLQRYKTAILLSVISPLISIICVLGMCLVYDETSHPLVSTPGFAVAICIGAAAYCIIRLPVEELKARKRQIISILIEFIYTPASIMALLALILAGNFYPEAVPILIFGHAIGVVFMVCGFWLFSVREICKISKLRKPGLLQAWQLLFHHRRDIFPVFVSVFSTRAFNASPYFVLPAILAPVELGFFALIHRIAGVIGTLTAASGNFVAPKVVEMHARGKSIKKAYWSSMTSNLLINLPIVLVTIILSSQILELFGRDFVQDSTINGLRILMGARLIVLLFGVPEIFLRMTGHFQEEAAVNMISLLCLAFLLFLLSLPYGLLGACVAIAICWCGRVLASYLIISKKFLRV